MKVTIKLLSRRPRSFGTIWGELKYVCDKVHDWLYVKKDKAGARRYRIRLARVLQQLPENDMAILREEGHALLHELEGDFACACDHRKKEVELIEQLHESVRKSVAAGDFDAKMGASILADWAPAALRRRREILRANERELSHLNGSAGNGVSRSKVNHRVSSRR